MEIGEASRCSLEACGVAELYFRILVSNFHHEILKTKAGGKDDVAASVNQLTNCRIALCTLWYVELVDNLIVAKTQSCLHLLRADIVVVGVTQITGVGDVDKAHLDIIQCYAR